MNSVLGTVLVIAGHQIAAVADIDSVDTVAADHIAVVARSPLVAAAIEAVGMVVAGNPWVAAVVGERRMVLVVAEERCKGCWKAVVRIGCIVVVGTAAEGSLTVADLDQVQDNLAQVGPQTAFARTCSFCSEW